MYIRDAFGRVFHRIEIYGNPRGINRWELHAPPYITGVLEVLSRFSDARPCRIRANPSCDITILRIHRCFCTYFSAAAAEHGCCAAAAASRRRELRLMTDVAESCAPFPLQLHHAHLQLHLLPLPLSLTDTDSTTVLDAHVFSPLHEFGASCPLPEKTRQGVSSYIDQHPFRNFAEETRRQPD